MSIKVCFFGALAEYLQKNEMLVDCQTPLSIKQLYAKVFADSADFGAHWQPLLLYAKNCEHVNPDTIVQSGDEVAFMPPMAGG